MAALSEFMSQEINKQMNNEFLNERVYLALASYFTNERLDGFAKFMRSQAEGEHGHALKFYDYLHDRLSCASLGPIEGVQGMPTAYLEAFSAAFALEEGTTRNIYRLYDIAYGEGDHGTCVFLQWFITEQIEEENTIDTWRSLVQRSSSFNDILEINEKFLEEFEDA